VVGRPGPRRDQRPRDGRLAEFFLDADATSVADEADRGCTGGAAVSKAPIPSRNDVVEATMTSGRQNEFVKVGRPENAITAELPSETAWEQSARGLRALGVDVDQAIVLHGPEGVSAFDVDGAEQGWWARAIRAWTNLGGSDANVLAAYDAALRAGRYVVLVPMGPDSTPGDITPEGIATVLGDQGGANIHYYRHGVLSRLG
jgi:hypothetical protein